VHKLSAYYAREYDLVAVEDLNVTGMLESPSNSRNTASAAWRTFLSLLEYKCEREGMHFVAVEPAGTTKERAACGVSTDKPLWVREHSCRSWGFTADRDWNAAWNILLGGGDLLGQRVVVGGLLQVLAEGGHENVRPVLAEHRCEGVGPVDKPVERQSRMSGPYSHSNVSDEGYVSGPSQRSPTRSSMKSNAMSMTPKGGSWYATSSVSVRRTTGG